MGDRNSTTPSQWTKQIAVVLGATEVGAQEDIRDHFKLDVVAFRVLYLPDSAPR